MSDMVQVPRRARHDDGLHVDDLDELDLPPHTELIEGNLHLMMSPQRSLHANIIIELVNQFRAQLGRDQWIIEPEMAVLIDKHNLPEPDVVVVHSQPDYGDDTTRYRAEDVAIAVEVESPATWRNDRGLKMDLYAGAGIDGYLLIGKDDLGVLQLDWYRLDGDQYRLVQRRPEVLDLGEPWDLTIDLRPV